MFSMFKKFFLFFILYLVGVCSTIAGEFEVALQSKQKIFLYLYTPDCGYCKRFNPVYNKLVESEKGYKFIKVDASTPYGSNLLAKYGGRYVPYVLLLNSSSKGTIQISPSCLGDVACVKNVLNDVKK